MLTFVVPGQPVGKGRPRFTRSGHTYTPQDTLDAEERIRAAFSRAYPSHVPIEGPLKLVVWARFRIPASWTKAKQQQAREGRILPTGKPDWDNIGKLVSDALNPHGFFPGAYLDDSQIVEATVEKRYGDPCLMVTLLSGRTE